MPVVINYRRPDGSVTEDYLPEDEYGAVCETFWMGDPRSHFTNSDPWDYRIVEHETRIVGDCEIHEVTVALPRVH